MRTAIIGAGNMGGSIARGLAKGSIIPASDIIVSNPSQGKLDELQAEFPALQITHDNQEAIIGAEFIILAVKPWLIKGVLRELKLKSKQIIISVAAGINFEELAHYVPEPEMTMFRIIPNTAISEMESMTLIASRNATKEQEQLMLLKYIQAAMQAGIEMGIYPKDAMRMVAQSVKGAAELILNNDTHPSVEIDKVCTPGGITIKGINELEHDGYTSAIINAIKASKQ